MKIIINSYNTLSAGTSIVSKNLLEALEHTNLPIKIHIFLPRLKIFRDFKNSESVHITRLPVFWWPFKYLFRFIYELFILPVIILIKKADVVLIMANYSPIRFKPRKIVLMQHSYLVDESIYTQLHFKTKLAETFRRFIFRRTLRSSHDIIVQSNYMKCLLEKTYNVRNCNVRILPNPLSKYIASINYSTSEISRVEEKIAFYVSRFNPHKNHEFILSLAETYKDIMQQENIKIYTTVNPNTSPSARTFIKHIQTSKLDDIVVNIGEIPHEEINLYYLKASCLFFPSKTESFGNALIEAMYFGLPILVPDLGYARAICEDAAYYYTPDNIDNAFIKLRRLCKNSSLRNEYSELSLKQSKKFPNVEEWANHIIRIIMQDR